MDVIDHITGLGYKLLRYYGVKTQNNTIMVYYQPDTEDFIRIVDMVCRIETGSYRPLCNTRLNLQQLNNIVDKLDSEKHSSVEYIKYPEGIDIKYTIIKPHCYTHTVASVTPEDIFAYGIVDCPKNDVYVPLRWESQDMRYRNGFPHRFDFPEPFKKPIWMYDKKMDVSKDDETIALAYRRKDESPSNWYDAKKFLDSPLGYEGEENMYFVLHKHSGCSDDICENLIELSRGGRLYHSPPPDFHRIYMRKNKVWLYIISDNIPTAYTTIDIRNFTYCEVRPRYIK